ncbi:Pycsar system effector family protein [Streptomyces sp. NPDC021224]|uniref:Pycsar system effector family protein n=1 Tax=unclassified Streptomyces TaxID=2593676 RepID=UPI0037B3B75A
MGVLEAWRLDVEERKLTTAPAADADPLRTAGPAVDRALATLRGELARADTKASVLLGLTGAALVAIGSGGGIPATAMGVAATGVAAFLAATVLLLLAVRPHLGGAGWPTWPTLSPDELHAAVLHGQYLAEVQVLASIAVAKFRRLRQAVHLVLAGAALLALAVLLWRV